MLILGVDPGSRATGYAALAQQGRRLALVASGTIRLDRRAELGPRLAELSSEMEQVLEQIRPAEVAVEDVFTHRNARSALALGHARGVVLASVARRGLPLAAYPPATVKRAVAGHGRAQKRQIQQMVQVLLGLGEVPGEDEADAIAVAVCHAMSNRARGSRDGAARRPR